MRMSSSSAAIADRDFDGSRKRMPATINATGEILFGLPLCARSLASANPSVTSRLTAPTSGLRAHLWLPWLFRTLTTASQDFTGRIRLTVGMNVSILSISRLSRAWSRPTRLFLTATGSRVLRPGFPPTLPWDLAARSPALVRSEMSRRSCSAIMPSIWSWRVPLGDDVSMASFRDRKWILRASSCSMIVKI